MAKEGEIIFTHPSMNKPLIVYVKPDQIVWSYGLNTRNYPTYGGEVIQILSMNVGDVQITGTIGTYKELEEIYSWFINYMQHATQTKTGKESYDTRPVIMKYPHRQWEFSIYPKSLPGFKYGKQVVAPVWALQAAVSEYNDNFKESVISDRMFAGEAELGGFDPFGTTTAGIGYKDPNKWSGPVGEDLKEAEAQNKEIADFFNHLTPNYLKGDWSSLEPNYSTPATPSNADQSKQKDNKKK